MKRPQHPKSVIVYHGPSRFDSKPIVAIVTGLRRSTKNSKTGRMAQLWILRADITPLEAIDRREDYSICGDCGLRGHGTKDRACYVNMRAPMSVYRAFKRGAYPTMDAADVATFLVAQDLPIRFGAYGEPVALPVHVLNDLAVGTTYTGYTHQWNAPNVARLYRHLLMASVDTTCRTSQAADMGWRTFRTRLANEPVLNGEIMCPASDEMGHRTTCADCALCDGTRGANDRRRNITIIVHGSSKKHYVALMRSDMSVVR